MLNGALDWFTQSKRIAIIGSVIIAVVVLVAYYPALKIRLAVDDLFHVYAAATSDLQQYLTFYFDPRMNSWYRPVFGILFWIQFAFFGLDSYRYHLFTLLLHSANSLLLFAIVSHSTKNWRLGFVSAFAYALFPPHIWAVLPFSDASPAMTLFSLFAILFWYIYLLRDSRLHYYLTIAFFTFALLTKETGAILLLTLFLFDRLLMRTKTNLMTLFWRYVSFIVILIPYLVVEFSIQRDGGFVRNTGYSLGVHIVSNFMEYSALLAFPWRLNSPFAYLWLVIAVTLFLVVGIKRQNTRLLFLGIAAVLNFLPVTPMAFILESRYLYLSLMASAILLAFLIEKGQRTWGQMKWYRAITSGVLVLSGLNGSLSVLPEAEWYESHVRTRRAPFRDISQRHPVFPEDTYLYFINSPYGPNSPIIDLSRLFRLHYGPGVSVGPLQKDQFARLRDHKVSYVYYFDETRRPIEVRVDKDAVTTSSLPLPVHFESLIRLEGYEITSSRMKRGEVFVLLLSWRAIGKIEKDYTVFVHLVNASGERVSGFDGQPQDGKERTGSWNVNQFTEDGHVLPITSDVPVGTNYRLEIGLYYLPTMERVGIVDAAGRVITDTLVIEPFSVVE